MGGNTAHNAGWVSGTSTPPPGLSINVSGPVPPATPIPGIVPSTSPSGAVLDLDSRSLLIGGARVLPLAGELHPARVPAAAWFDDLRKLKAGGLDTVSSYVFWLHVEEVQGVQDWSGNNNLTAYLAAAQAAGLHVALRIGPWCHGEARSGGFPDWVNFASGVPLRSNNSAFLALVRPWYAGIAAQIAGFAWAEGGPIVSVQLDNETPDVEYLLALRALAVEVGIAPSLFIKTGWPSPSRPVPSGELIPVYGGCVLWGLFYLLWAILIDR